MNDNEKKAKVEEITKKTKECFVAINKAFEIIATEMKKQRAFMVAQLILDVVFALKLLNVI